ncbi:MAG TPA: hypothetical protein EYN66_03025 [Myxococcales bacterium]|nr:hypothetical protein [Myxococcales bacterium]
MKRTLQNSLIIVLTLVLMGCFSSLEKYQSSDKMRSENGMTVYKSATKISLKLAAGWESTGPPDMTGSDPIATFKKQAVGTMSVICYKSILLSKSAIQNSLRTALKTQTELTGSGWKNIGPLPLSVDVRGMDPEFEVLRYNNIVDGKKTPMVAVHAWRLTNLGACTYGITAHGQAVRGDVLVGDVIKMLHHLD